MHGFAEACRQYGFTPGVQLHNTVTEKTIGKICQCNLPMTAHAPVVSNYSLNLATEKNLDIIFSAFEENADFCRRHNITKSVFHALEEENENLLTFPEKITQDEL